MTYAKLWNLGFYQHREKVDKIKVKVKIKLPDSVKHSWAHQVYWTAPKGKAIFAEYDGTIGNTATYIILHRYEMPSDLVGSLLTLAGLWSHEYNLKPKVSSDSPTAQHIGDKVIWGTPR